MCTSCYRWQMLLPLPLFLSLFLLTDRGVFGEIHSDSPYSPLNITIKMEKTVFMVGEPVEGKVIVENTYPANLPAVFDIKLFHDGKMFPERSTAIKGVPSGTTEFSFKGFGIPQFNLTPAAEGLWRITIVQQNLDSSYAQEVTLRITAIPPQNKVVQ